MRFLLTILVAGFLAGCGLIPSAAPAQSVVVSITPEPTPAGVTNGSVMATGTIVESTPVPDKKNLNMLSIWVPVQFDPNVKSQAAIALIKTVQEFESENPGVTVEIRVKAETGPSGLMETLGMAASAAPDVMPSLVLLTRSQMEDASRKGIIFPYEGLTAVLDETDWYPFARELATFQGDMYGMPLSGNVLALVARGKRTSSEAPSWDEIQKLGSTVLFAAADPQAAVPLALYRSAGGRTQDEQSLPQIQPVELEKTLTLLASGADNNIFPPWLINYQTDDKVLETFSNQQGGWVITWLSNYLADKPNDTSLFPVPSLGAGSATFASGSVWALADTNPERRQLSVKLAEFLGRSEFLSAWNLANNTLPPRPSALTSWPDTPLRAQLNQVALAAEIRPPIDILNTLGPAVQEATLLILKKQSDPATAAQTAVQRLAAPVSN
jgi:ABC-type glycerol-3-phosphate transport system substrate-binding protein